jgi:uncharacterized membrane protein
VASADDRQAAKDRLAAALDYEVNVKAEVSIAHLHDKIDQLQERIEALLAMPQPNHPKQQQKPLAEAAE